MFGRLPDSSGHARSWDQSENDQCQPTNPSRLEPLHARPPCRRHEPGKTNFPSNFHTLFPAAPVTESVNPGMVSHLLYKL
ncbi:unnamed protein product [Prunus armeniaca]